MFALSKANIAYKSGIFDLVPAEDESLSRKTSAFMQILYLTESLAAQVYATYSQPSVTEAEREMAIATLREHVPAIAKCADKNARSFDHDREKKMCNTITEGYTPGSALICGLSHVRSLERLLSKRFTIRTYEIGREFLDRDGMLKVD